MVLLVVLSVLVTGFLAWLLRGERGRNASAWLAAVAASRLPRHRQDWGRAMVAELAVVRGGARRWQFAAGVLRVALVLQPRPRALMLLAAAGGGLAVTAAGTAAAAIGAPDLSVFAAVLGLLLTGYTIFMLPLGQRRPRPSRPALVAAAAAAIGMAASITAVARIAVAYPAAAADRTHVFSVLFAFTVVGYLAGAPTLARRGGQPSVVLCWGLAGALASGAVWVIAAVARPVGTDGIAVWLWPVGAAAAFAASAGAAACRSRRAGFRAGVLAAILGAPLHFVTDLTALLAIRHYALTNSYDIAAYPLSGYHDVASYVLSDAVSGNILAGLVLYPLSWLVLAALGAAAGTDLSAFTARHATHRP